MLQKKIKESKERQSKDIISGAKESRLYIACEKFFKRRKKEFLREGLDVECEA